MLFRSHDTQGNPDQQGANIHHTLILKVPANQQPNLCSPGSTPPRSPQTVIRHYFCSYFLSIFDPTSLHIPYPTVSPLCLPLLCFISLCLHAHDRRQEHDSTGITGHRTTHLLGYQHPETVLLWFLLTRILHWNLLCCH